MWTLPSRAEARSVFIPIRFRQGEEDALPKPRKPPPSPTGTTLSFRAKKRRRAPDDTPVKSAKLETLDPAAAKGRASDLLQTADNFKSEQLTGSKLHKDMWRKEEDNA